MKILLFLIIVCLNFFVYSANALPYIISKQEDTATVNQLVRHSKTLVYSVPDQAWNECNKAIEISKKINYALGLANAYRLAGVIQADIRGNNSLAIQYYHLADSIYSSGNDIRFREGSGAVLHSYGTIFQRQGDYLKAVQYYIKAAKLLDSIHNKTILPKTLNNLSTLYAFLKQYDKSIDYARQCIRLANETRDSFLISMGNITLAGALIDQGHYEEAFPCIQKAIELAKKRNDHYILGLGYYNLGNYYGYFKKKYKPAIEFHQKALDETKKLGNQWEEARTLTNLAEIYLITNDFPAASQNAEKALNLADSLKSGDIRQRALLMLSKTEAHNKNYKTAYTYLLQSLTLHDSIFQDEKQRNINYLESLYQTEKKEKEILKLQKEKEITALIIKRNRTLNYALAITIVLILSIAFFTFRGIRNKRIIARQELELERQKVIKLEKEHQLLAAQSLLKGEEAERSRLARDLHDGLGGLLSGVKLALSGVKGNYVVPQSNVNQLDRALNLLDNSIGELRRVAHNMMPEALIKFGLREALQDFCDQLQSKEIQVNFQFYGEDKRVSQSLEITLYRVSQELLNNAVKYSGAGKILIQLIRDQDRISLTVQDNGKGFDSSLLKESKGSGISNIRSRVEAMNGRFDLFTESGKGTEATVEFDL